MGLKNKFPVGDLVNPNEGKKKPTFFPSISNFHEINIITK
jgi:hypothetical protein